MATKYQGKYYRSRLYMGVDDVGRAKNKDFYSKISQKDADEKRDRYKESLGIGANTNTLKMRFCDVSEDWLEYKKHQLTKKDKKYIGKSQIQNYQCYLKQINKFIGNKKIGKIDESDLRLIIYNLSVKNPNTGKPASSGYLNDIRQTLSQIYDYLIDVKKVFSENPVKKIETLKTNRKLRDAITDEQQEAILEMINCGHRMETAALLMLVLGLRREEVIALTWGKINFEKGTLKIDEAASLLINQPELKETKTAKSERLLFVPEFLLEHLKKQKETAKAKKKDCVCPSKAGKMMSESSWRTGWKSYCIEVDRYIRAKKGEELPSKYSPKYEMKMEEMTPHMLRHTAATNMHRAGIPVGTAQAILGHADVRTTLEVYTHADKLNDMRKAAEKLNEL